MTSASVILAVTTDQRRSSVALVGQGAEVVGEVAAVPCTSDLAALADLIERKLKDAHDRGLTTLGLAFALPDGPSWLEFQKAVAARSNLPSTSEWVARAALRGEHLQGAAKHAGSAVLLDIDGLKLGLLLDGRPYAGANGKAGDISHLGIDRTGSVRCTCGRTGCLKALLAADAPLPPRSKAFSPGPSRSLGWVAIATIAVVNTLNPALVILRGSAVADSSGFDWLAVTVRHGCLGPTRAGLVDIVRARDDSTLVGAAAGFAALCH